MIAPMIIAAKTHLGKYQNKGVRNKRVKATTMAAVIEDS